MQDHVIRVALVAHPPWTLSLDHHGNELFVRFINHDDGEVYRALQGHRTGWFMFVGVPFDYRNVLAEVVGTFGQFHYWNHQDDRLVRSLVYASFPDNLSQEMWFSSVCQRWRCNCFLYYLCLNPDC